MNQFGEDAGEETCDVTCCSTSSSGGEVNSFSTTIACEHEVEDKEAHFLANKSQHHRLIANFIIKTFSQEYLRCARGGYVLDIGAGKGLLSYELSVFTLYRLKYCLRKKQSSDVSRVHRSFLLHFLYQLIKPRIPCY